MHCNVTNIDIMKVRKKVYGIRQLGNNKIATCNLFNNSIFKSTDMRIFSCLLKTANYVCRVLCNCNTWSITLAAIHDFLGEITKTKKR